jgi:hypothetical protein
MRCPKCQFDHPLQTTECLKCGIVFSRYRANPEEPNPANTTAIALPMARVAPLSAVGELSEKYDPLRELKYRALAFPLAFIVAYWATGTGFNMLAGMLAMVVHESGHAVTAWLAGRWAIPTFWVTPYGQSRSWLIVLMVTCAILAWGFFAWRAKQWALVGAAGVVLILQIFMLSRSPSRQDCLIVFFGDGGAMVLATILMATFYAPRESKLYQSWGLRWGLLAIGALAFMHVFRLWSGPYENIPFGEIEGVNLSDPSLLTTLYGWSVTRLVDRYLLLAKFCFAAMIGLYFWGLLSAYAEVLVAKKRDARAG